MFCGDAKHMLVADMSSTAMQHQSYSSVALRCMCIAHIACRYPLCLACSFGQCTWLSGSPCSMCTDMLVSLDYGAVQSCYDELKCGTDQAVKLQSELPVRAVFTVKCTGLKCSCDAMNVSWRCSCTSFGPVLLYHAFSNIIIEVQTYVPCFLQ